jgi:hypothetical protein
MLIRLSFGSVLLLLGGCAGTQTPAAAPERCPPSVTATVTPDKPTVHVAYTEPTVKAESHPLKALAKTTIYYDMGQGRTEAKQVPATTPSGGGEISETITVPLPESRPAAVRICVTATDRSGLESQTTP